MASIIVNIEKGIEVAAEDALKFLTGAAKLTSTHGPGVVAGLGVLLGQVNTALSAVSETAANPLNITMDVTTVNDLKQVWPDIVSFAGSLGIKL